MKSKFLALATCLFLAVADFAAAETIASATVAVEVEQGLQLQKPAIKGSRGFQGVTWVDQEGLFYSTWNRRNSDGSERVNIVRHDRRGKVIDYSETTGPGSSSALRLGHGQTIDHLVLNGVLTFVTSSEGNRGVTLFERAGSGNGWKLKNVRKYTLQPPEVTASTVSLSLDKSSVIITGGPYRGHKNIRVWPLASILSGPQGDRTSDGTPFEEMMQPRIKNANQGMAFDGTTLLMLNGNNIVSDPKMLTRIDWATKSVIGADSIINGKSVAMSQNNGAGNWYEPEGLFLGPGTNTLWMGIGTQDRDGKSWSSFVLPIFDLK